MENTYAGLESYTLLKVVSKSSHYLVYTKDIRILSECQTWFTTKLFVSLSASKPMNIRIMLAAMFGSPVLYSPFMALVSYAKSRRGLGIRN